MSRITRTAISLILTLAMLLVAAPPAVANPQIQTPTGSWLAQYWNGIDFAGTPVLQRVETSINHNWGVGSPAAAVQNDFFSARWTGSFSLPAGAYRLTARTDDGVRVRVNNALVIDDWNQRSAIDRVAEVQLTAGLHTIVVESFEAQGDAVAIFSVESVVAPGLAGISISPTTGPAGSIVQVHAWGFWRYANVSVSLAPQGGAAVHTHVVAADTEGRIWTTVTMPGAAAPGSLWVVIARADGREATSPAFRIAGAVTPPTTSPCGPHYTVRPGDWLFQIARICHVSVADLLRANPQITNPSRLLPGQVLNIPAVGTPPPPPAVSVTATTRFSLNFRTAPSTSARVLSVIPTGTTVPVIARGPSNWILVRWGGREGWIAGWLCNIHGNLAGLPHRSG